MKDIDGRNADGAESMFILTILEKYKRNETKSSSRKCNNIIMVKYQEGRVKLTNTQLNKLKFAAKNKTGTKLRIKH